MNRQQQLERLIKQYYDFYNTTPSISLILELKELLSNENSL